MRKKCNTPALQLTRSLIFSDFPTLPKKLGPLAGGVQIWVSKGGLMNLMRLIR